LNYVRTRIAIYTVACLQTQDVGDKQPRLWCQSPDAFDINLGVACNLNESDV